MSRIIIFVGLTFALGCNAAKQVNTGPVNANVARQWKITLAETQSAAYQTTDKNPTAIAISLKQSDAIVTADPAQKIWAGNTACANEYGSWWWSQGGWETTTYAITSLDSALVSGNTVSLNFTEANPGAASGQLKLIGTLQTDGSISGTLTDSCILSAGNPTNTAWTATRLSPFPPTVWP